MQSFGDDTLLACIDIEKGHRILREQAGCEAPLRKGNVSDRDKRFFESCSLLSDLASDANDVDKPKPPDGRGTGVEDAADLTKYFEDSIIFPKISGRRNLASGAPRRNAGLSQSSRSSRNTSQENGASSKERRRPGTANDTEKCDGSDPCKNKSPGNAQDATSSSGIKTSSINDTYDRENSAFIISSPPLCTQDRCKLALWGLPPNVLQVLYYNKYLGINKYQKTNAFCTLCYNFLN